MMVWICGCRSLGTLSLLASLTREVIKAREQNGKEDDTWAVEALDILFDTWTVLLQVRVLLSCDYEDCSNAQVPKIYDINCWFVVTP